MMPTISQSGLLGIQRGLQRVTDAASNIATADRDINIADLAANKVELKLSEQQVAASVMALKVDDQLRGTLFNIKV